MAKLSNKINTPKIIDEDYFRKQLIIAEKILKEINFEIYTQNTSNISNNKDITHISYKAYYKERNFIQNNINKQISSVYNQKENMKAMENAANNSYIPTPIELLTNIKLTEEEFEDIHNEFYEVTWEKIFDSSILRTSIENSYLTIKTKEPEKFANNLYQHVKNSDDEIKSIFTLDFLKEITRSNWWILPNFNLETYKEFSNKKISHKEFNKIILSKFSTKPELITNMIKQWDISNEREDIIYQIYNNYIFGYYEVCTIALILQIEGIIKDITCSKNHSTKLIKELIKKLKNKLKKESYRSKEIFYINLYIEFLYSIICPFYVNVDFDNQNINVNRHKISHCGRVNSNQIISIKLFLIINSLMEISKILK